MPLQRISRGALGWFRNGLGELLAEALKGGERRMMSPLSFMLKQQGDAALQSLGLREAMGFAVPRQGERSLWNQTN